MYEFTEQLWHRENKRQQCYSLKSEFSIYNYWYKKAKALSKPHPSPTIDGERERERERQRERGGGDKRSIHVFSKGRSAKLNADHRVQ